MFQNPAMQRHSPLSSQPAPRARWATCIALTAAVLVSACGGGGDDDNTPPGPSPAPAVSPVPSANYVGDWVSQRCETFGNGSTREMLRVSAVSDTELDVSLAILNYAGADCTGATRVAHPLEGTANANRSTTDRVVLQALETSAQAFATLYIHRGKRDLTARQRPGLDGSNVVSDIWFKTDDGRMCLLDDRAIYDTSGPHPAYPDAAAIAADYVKFGPQACFTAYTAGGDTPALPLPMGENGSRYVGMFRTNITNLDRCYPPYGLPGSARFAWRFTPGSDEFTLLADSGSTRYPESDRCEGNYSYEVDQDQSATIYRLHAGQIVADEIVHRYASPRYADRSRHGVSINRSVMLLKDGAPCGGLDRLLWPPPGSTAADNPIDYSRSDGLIYRLPPTDEELAALMAHKDQLCPPMWVGL